MPEETQGVPSPGTPVAAEPYVAPGYDQAYEDGGAPAVPMESPSPSSATTSGRRPPALPPAASGGDGGDEDDGMLRMSFMEHLEELRRRIIWALVGLVVAFVLCISFADRLWTVVSEPAIDALKHLHANPPKLAQITPMEGFMIIWFKLPLLASLFVGSPWILFQVWSFIAPGLYKRERRYAVPFILSTAGLFIAGGLFAYFVAFRFGLEFLLGIGMINNVQPVITITEYFDLFVNVILGISCVFELPVLIFFLTLIRVASPRFLLRHSRYAILAIVILAAVITPTPDVFNLMLFAVPMNLLYFAGVGASYLLVMKREGRRFPWKHVLLWLGIGLLVIAGTVWLLVVRYHFRLLPHWPFLSR
jgi:sec-independent protein translocase protein TatC